MVFAPSIAAALALLAGAGPWSYRVRQLTPELRAGVEARFDDPVALDFDLHEEARGHVELLEVAPLEGPFRAVTERAPWRFPECARGCRLRYQLPLATLTEAAAGTNGSQVYDEGIVSSTALWLIHPEDAPLGGRYTVRFEPLPGFVFSSGLEPVGPRTFEGPADEMELAPYAALGRLMSTHVDLPGGRVEILHPPHAIAAGDRALLAWIGRSLQAVASYYGRFPVDHALLVVVPVRGDEVRFGSAMGFGGASVRLLVGRQATAAALAEDWQLIHELCHLALANVGRRHHWLEEGYATYVEPLVRVRAGMIDEVTFWRDLSANLPQGLPGFFSRGFEGTRQWGEIYWGGALYFFEADLEIRRRTRNRRSLDDALQAIVAARQTIEVRADPEEVLAHGDRATGTSVLVDLFRAFSKAPRPVDLAARWRELGVIKDGERVRFDERAAGAEIRRAISARALPQLTPTRD